MRLGNLRIGIMNDCPDDFSDKLKSFIDGVELALVVIKNDLEAARDANMQDVCDCIDSAFDGVESLKDSLY